VIPPFNISRVLPPFVGQTPADPASTSPYEASAVEVVGRFATSRERVALLNGLFDYRSALRAIGIVDGFQWINGSFVEEVEVTRQRPPADIDLITCASRPVADQAAWVALVQSNQQLFDWRQTKATYKCDAYFLDLGKAPNAARQSGWGTYDNQDERR
jgi:hypothetical protein